MDAGVESLSQAHPVHEGPERWGASVLLTSALVQACCADHSEFDYCIDWTEYMCINTPCDSRRS